MIIAISYHNLNAHYGLYLSSLRLRHQEFIERQRYDVRTLNGMEFDEYDTLAAVYLVYSENGQDCLGVSRLTPTDKGCMLADHWPELVDDKSLLNSPEIWEGTRFCIDKGLPSDLRRRICHELACAYLEFAMANGIQKIIGLMPTFILRSVFERSGITLERLGKIMQIGAHPKIQAASILVTNDQLKSVEATTGLSGVLEQMQSTANYLLAREGRAA
ncbi:acyl-homoserine-lactone synthase [Asticcacaulis machinosus]|uniref:Acyl-homoserine-lactone synthase n=1 Tax=Asticcacaulis machinosus TaxID=2984211 RepID=A0ABT5HG35_9CAUL|nr:acyl-homoserine-lactone synthase [Asticcacaulis machinosus]MDC7675202.1 acyl-homoserine-lactone synthase [Asticcacaulis machinosus]